jgi:hypothetical protein
MPRTPRGQAAGGEKAAPDRSMTHCGASSMARRSFGALRYSGPRIAQIVAAEAKLTSQQSPAIDPKRRLAVREARVSIRKLLGDVRGVELFEPGSTLKREVNCVAPIAQHSQRRLEVPDIPGVTHDEQHLHRTGNVCAGRYS